MKRRPTSVPGTGAPAAVRKSVAASELRVVKASELIVIESIQRTPTDDRIRRIGLAWDDEQVGTLQVARILDPGVWHDALHVYDGGTRLRSAVKYVDPDYPFECLIKPKTLVEAAEAFLVFNGLSQKPNAYSRFKVGVECGEPNALAIQVALAAVGVEATAGTSKYGNGDPGLFAAFAAAERVVKTHFARHGSYDDAAVHLAWCLSMTREAFPQHGLSGPAQAHDADAVQAVSYLGLTYGSIVGKAEAEARVRHAMTTWMGKSTKDTKLFANGEPMTPERWRVALVAQDKAKSGGSASRGYQIGGLIAQNHNRGLKPVLRKTV